MIHDLTREAIYARMDALAEGDSNEDEITGRGEIIEELLTRLEGVRMRGTGGIVNNCDAEVCSVCGQADNCGDCDHYGTSHYRGDRLQQHLWEIAVLRATVSARNLHTGEIREVYFGAGDNMYRNVQAALRAIGRTIDADRARSK